LARRNSKLSQDDPNGAAADCHRERQQTHNLLWFTLV
jgi:hypothetical protein